MSSAGHQVERNDDNRFCGREERYAKHHFAIQQHNDGSVVFIRLKATNQVLAPRAIRHMLDEFDQSTIAKMTAALDYVCNKIPTSTDSAHLRKQIADEIICCARSGKSNLVDLQEAGLSVLKATAKSDRARWFDLRRLFSQ